MENKGRKFCIFFCSSTFIKGKVFPSTMYVCVRLDMCALMSLRETTDREDKQRKQHHKKETIHRHQHDEEKNLQISIACVCICKISYVCICMYVCACIWVKKNQQRKIFVEENFLFIFNFHYLHLISSCMCTHIFRENWENEKNWVWDDVGGWQITEVGWNCGMRKRGGLYTQFFPSFHSLGLFRI